MHECSNYKTTSNKNKHIGIKDPHPNILKCPIHSISTLPVDVHLAEKSNHLGDFPFPNIFLATYHWSRITQSTWKYQLRSAPQFAIMLVYPICIEWKRSSQGYVEESMNNVLQTTVAKSFYAKFRSNLFWFDDTIEEYQTYRHLCPMIFYIYKIQLLYNALLRKILRLNMIAD